MKKTGFILMIAVLMLAGCSSGKAANTPTALPLVGELTFAGSTTIQPLAGDLGNVFQQEHPLVKLDIAGGGSKVGIQAIHDGTVDIGMASRDLTADETKGINTYTIALDVIALIVHPGNSIEDLKLADLAAIYNGSITNWSQVGGPDLEILPVVREASSGTRGAFNELVLGNMEPAATNLLTAVTAGDVAADVAHTPGAIGYVGFGNLDKTVKLISINGIVAAKATTSSHQYPLVRSLNLMTGPLSQPLAMDFINFVLSAEGQGIIENAGWVAVK